MRRGGFDNARPAHGLVYSSLDDLLSEMMPPLDSASWVDAAWKDPLPRPRGIRVRYFTASASGIQTLPNPSATSRSCSPRTPSRWRLSAADRTLGRVVVRSLFPFPDLTTTSPVSKSKVLHAQPQPLQQSHARPVEALSDELRGATQLPQQQAHFAPRQHHRDSSPPRRTHEIVQHGNSSARMSR